MEGGDSGSSRDRRERVAARRKARAEAHPPREHEQEEAHEREHDATADAEETRAPVADAPVALDNPYAPPRDWREPDKPRTRSRSAVFSVRPLKLVVLSLVTLDLYPLYWLYRNWQLALRSGQSVSPLLRTLFAALFSYSAFRRVRAEAMGVGVDPGLPAGLLAMTFALLPVFSQLPTPAGLLGLLGFLPVYAANNVAAQINERVGDQENHDDRFTVWNWVCIALGGPFLLLSLFLTLR